MRECRRARRAPAGARASLRPARTGFLFLGRGRSYPIALEGALKLKEISYIHAEGYAAGEMKHGPIALIDENMPVVVLVARGAVLRQAISNLAEVRAREGKVIAIATKGDNEIGGHADDVVLVPDTALELQPILTVVPLQLLALLRRRPQRHRRRPAAQPREVRHRRMKLTHFTGAGDAHVVDVTAKPETARAAIASGEVAVEPATARAIRKGALGKGDVLAVARLAGIQAAKRTPDLVPLCHPLRLTGVEVELRDRPKSSGSRRPSRRSTAAASKWRRSRPSQAAALTVYDMCKAIDRGIVIAAIRLDEKRGGKSGRWRRPGRAAGRQRRRRAVRFNRRRGRPA